MTTIEAPTYSVLPCKPRSKVPEIQAPAVTARMERLCEIRKAMEDLEQESKMIQSELSSVLEPIRASQSRNKYTASLNVNGCLRYEVQNLWTPAPIETLQSVFGAAGMERFWRHEDSYTVDKAVANEPTIKWLVAEKLVTHKPNWKPHDYFMELWTKDAGMKTLAQQCGIQPRTQYIRITGADV